MKKLFLIDAYASIYRSYYAFIKNPRINSKGLNTSAIFGFVNILEDILKREKPTHIAVAFDPPGPTFRHEIFKDYKAQRQATPEDIKKSIPIIKKIIEAYNIPVLEITGFEADDVIGTIAKKAEKANFKTYMLTADKDYGQLVSEHTFMYKPKFAGGFETLGKKEITEKYGLKSQQQIIDLLALMGDSSDNIPGCPGVGEKTAIKLLQEFDSIENLLKNTHKLTGALKTKVEENKEQIEFSRFLASIKTDVPIDFEEERLMLKKPNEEQLYALLNELEFKTIIAKMGKTPDPTTTAKQTVSTGQMSLFDLFEEKEEKKQPEIIQQTTLFQTSNLKTINDIEHNYQIIDNQEKIDKLLQELNQQKEVCFDTETTGINVFTSQLAGISFCWKKNEAYYLPLPENLEETKEILHQFKAFFENENIDKIGQNIKFDFLMLKTYNIEVKGKMFDTMIAHYLIQPELRHGMDYLAEIYLGYKTIHYEDLLGPKGKNQANIRSVDPNKVCLYACEDADITFQLKEMLEKELNDLEKLFYQIEMPLMRVLAIMELNGVQIDAEALKQSSGILSQEMKNIEQEVFKITGFEFNINSPKQVGEILFERLKIDDKAKKTKTGQYSTNEEILEKLRNKNPIVGKILDYRGIKKLLGTYVDALPELINPKTKRVHTSYNQTVTSTGRLSSSSPNLQNIPIRDERGKEIRKAFIADENSVFLSADYSQIELRIMAHLSDDENMQEAFNSGYDIHAATAAKIYRIPIDKVTSDMRRKAKTANFGIIYGISTFGLSERLNIPRSEAKELIDGYFETYPKVKEYINRSIALAKENGYVETLLGRKRYLSDINSANSIVRGFAERNAINAPIQGTAADIIKIAMVRIQNRFERENIKTKMTMQVHDELNFIVPNEELEKVKKMVVEEMENAVKLAVPIVVDCGVGSSWFEAH